MELLGKRIGFGLYQLCRNRESMGRVCVCFGCGGVCDGMGVDGSLAPWSARVDGVMSVCVVSLDSCRNGRARYLCIVLAEYLRILGAPSVQSCCTLSISAS